MIVNEEEVGDDWGANKQVLEEASAVLVRWAEYTTTPYKDSDPARREAFRAVMALEKVLTRARKADLETLRGTFPYKPKGETQ